MAITYTKALRSVRVNTLGGSTARAVDTDTDPYASNAYSQFQKHETMELVRSTKTLVPFHAVETVETGFDAFERTREDPYCEAESGDVAVILLANEGSGISIYAEDSPLKPLTTDDFAPYIADCGEDDDGCVNAHVHVSYNGTPLLYNAGSWVDSDSNYRYGYSINLETFEFLASSPQ